MTISTGTYIWQLPTGTTIFGNDVFPFTHGITGSAAPETQQASFVLLNSYLQTRTVQALTGSGTFSGVANTKYLFDISGLSGNKNFVLPAGVVGNEIEVSLTVGDNLYGLIIKGDTGISIGTGTAATEWSRLFIAGETVRLVAKSSTNWQVIHDGRIPCVAALHISGDQTSISSGVATKVNLNASDADNAGGMTDASNGKIVVRRAGKYRLDGLVVDALTTAAARALTLLYKNGSQIASAETNGGAGSFPSPWAISPVLSWAVNDYAELYGYQNSGNSSTFIGGALSGGPCQLALTEILS